MLRGAESPLKEKGKDPFKQGLKRGKAEQGAGSKKKKKKKGGKTKKKTAASGKADGEAGKKKIKLGGTPQKNNAHTSAACTAYVAFGTNHTCMG